MEKRKKYSKPFMIAEQFMPNSYCEICVPKEEVSYTLTDPYRNCQFFVTDDDNDGWLDDEELNSVITTDNSQPETTVVNTSPSLCWPVIGEHNHHPTRDQVDTNCPLWYIMNPNTSSGHVYGYQTMIINYNHS